MTAVEFPQQTQVIAKNQPPYRPLPVHCNFQGVVTSCWKLTEGELAQAAKDGFLYVYVSQCTFGNKLQPLSVQTIFNPPKL